MSDITSEIAVIAPVESGASQGDQPVPFWVAWPKCECSHLKRVHLGRTKTVKLENGIASTWFSGACSTETDDGYCSCTSFNEFKT